MTERDPLLTDEEIRIEVIAAGLVELPEMAPWPQDEIDIFKPLLQTQHKKTMDAVLAEIRHIETINSNLDNSAQGNTEFRKMVMDWQRAIVPEGRR